MTWLDDTTLRTLHLLSRVALRCQPPLRARGTLRRVARHFRPYTLDEAVRAEKELRGRGTCLSRALTVAARLPGSDVVIGVNPRLGPTLRAHAWVEHGGCRLDGPAPFVEEIARLGA